MLKRGLNTVFKATPTMEPTVVVVEVSSNLIRVGLHSDQSPPVVEANVVGILPNPNGEYKYYCGNEALDNARDLDSEIRIVYPIKRNLKPDWKLFHLLIDMCFHKLGNVNPLSSHIVIAISSHVLNKGSFVDLRNLFMNTYRFKTGTCIDTSLAASIACFGYGNVGIVLHIQDYYTRISNIPRYTKSLPIGSQTVSDHLMRLLSGKGVYLLSKKKEHRDIIEAIKYKMCYCAMDFEKESQQDDFVKPVKTNVGNSMPEITQALGKELFIAPEVLFQPSLMGFDCMGIVDFLQEGFSIDTTQVLFLGECFAIPRLVDRIKASYRQNQNIAWEVDTTGASVWEGTKQYALRCLGCKGHDGVNGWAMEFPISSLRSRPAP